jgi:hypothetical protein
MIEPIARFDYDSERRRRGCTHWLIAEPSDDDKRN